MIQALLFDMDGTLVDSETQTDAAIAAVLARQGHAGASLPPEETRGRTWGDIVQALLVRFPEILPPSALEAELIAEWSAATATMTPIAGAPAAVRAAAAHFAVGVVSSSPRDLIERLLVQLGVRDSVRVCVGAGDVTRPKPDPEGFLRAAEQLGVKPDACVVFEDSRAGLLAARAASMASMLVLARCDEPVECRALATAAFRDYLALGPSFWGRLRTEGVRALEELA